MSTVPIRLAKRFADSLDRRGYDALFGLIATDCQYEIQDRLIVDNAAIIQAFLHCQPNLAHPGCGIGVGDACHMGNLLPVVADNARLDRSQSPLFAARSRLGQPGCPWVAAALVAEPHEVEQLQGVRGRRDTWTELVVEGHFLLAVATGE
jgi:hypothetical protein